MDDPAGVILVAEGPTRSGGPAAWVHGLASALEAAGVDARLVYSADVAGLTRTAREGLGNATVVHTYSQSPGSLWFARAARARFVPVVHTVHGDFFAEQATKRGLRKPLWLPFNRRAVASASVITVPSGYLARKLAEADPALGAGIVVIPNGIDTAALAAIKPLGRQRDLGLPADMELVVAVTTFTHRAKAEGVLPLCEAIERLRAEGRRVELRIAGEGVLRAEVQGRCAGAGGGTRFMGYVPDASRLIAAADVFVHSSGLDVFAYVVLEAFAAGTPTVVTPVGGIPELVGDAAKQVPPSDPDAMARAIATLLDDRALADEMLRRGLARAADFDWGRLVQEQWLPLYRRVLHERPV